MLRCYACAVRAFALAGVATLFVQGALGEVQDATPLTLRQAVEEAVRGNPDLKAFGYSLRAQDARTRQADLRPLPEFGVELENVLGSGATNGFDAAETTFALSQVIELGGKRADRVAVAQAQRDVLTVEQQAAQLDVLAEVTRRFIEVAADQQHLALTRQATELTRKTVTAVDRRVKAAKSPEVELHRANVEAIRAEIELRHAEHKLAASRRRLAAMWGAQEAAFGAVESDLYALPDPVEFDALVARLSANPDFVRFASDARLRDAELRLAQTRRSPDVKVGGGVRRFEESNDHALVFEVSFPLFAGRQAAPALAEAEALRGRVDAEREAAFVKARADVFDLYQELRHSSAEAERLRRDAVPQMEEALRETEYAYERGRYSYLELVDGQRAYLDVRRSLIEAAANAQTLQAEIERLTGEPLPASQSTSGP